MFAHNTPKTVVITGGTAGVGRATARAFAAEGSAVGVIARGKDRLDETVAELRTMGARAAGVLADVADAQALDHAADVIEAALGPIDCWVNNAMTSVFARATEITPEEFRRVTEVTYLGVVHGTQTALKRMVPRERKGKGVIVQVGSALAYRGIPLQAPYCAAKHAIVGFTESLRTELMHDGLDGIHVTMVHLPAMNTPQFDWILSRLPHRAQPVPPIYQPEVAARAIVWASTHRRRQLFVGFPTFKTVWGSRLAPWYADRVLAESGFSSQQTDEPRDKGRPSNLWEPVPGDYAAHGRFDDRSRRWSWWTHLTEHPVAACGAALLLGAAAAKWME